MEFHPVSEGDVLKQKEVMSKGEDGDAIVREQGFIIFVTDTKTKEVGDTLDIKITRAGSRYGFAEEISD